MHSPQTGQRTGPGPAWPDQSGIMRPDPGSVQPGDKRHKNVGPPDLGSRVLSWFTGWWVGVGGSIEARAVLCEAWVLIIHLLMKSLTCWEGGALADFAGVWSWMFDTKETTHWLIRIQKRKQSKGGSPCFTTRSISFLKKKGFVVQILAQRDKFSFKGSRKASIYKKNKFLNIKYLQMLSGG